MSRVSEAEDTEPQLNAMSIAIPHWGGRGKKRGLTPLSLLQIHHDAKGSLVLHCFGFVGTSNLEYFKQLFKCETGKRIITVIPGILVALELPSDHCDHLVMIAHCYQMRVFSFSVSTCFAPWSVC